jgi:hypothetical protein
MLTFKAGSFTPMFGGDNPLDCIYDINHGAYKFCTVTQKVSIAGSIVFLMLQLLVSRIIFPGVSNFLNASVGTPLLLARGSRLPCARRQSVQRLFFDARCRFCAPIPDKASQNRPLWRHAEMNGARRKLWR